MKIYFSKDFLVSDNGNIEEIDKHKSAINVETIQDIFNLLKKFQNYTYCISYDKDNDCLWMSAPEYFNEYNSFHIPEEMK